MDIEKLINVKKEQFEELERQWNAVAKQIQELQQKGQAIHRNALEVKAVLETLASFKQQQEEELKGSATAKLILPEGTKPITLTEAK